jgi:hypothetical protein
VEIPGVGNMTFLRTALNAQRKARGEAEVSAPEFLKLVREQAKALQIDAEMLKRPVNVGFSGGEKKRNEILQMAVLEPRMCILDETDSGLDVDAMKLVARRRERAARRRSAPSSSSRTTSGCSTTSCPTSCTSCPTGASSKTGGPELALRGRGRTATPRSSPEGRMAMPTPKLTRKRRADRGAARGAPVPARGGMGARGAGAGAGAAARHGRADAAGRVLEVDRPARPDRAGGAPVAPAVTVPVARRGLFAGSRPARR